MRKISKALIVCDRFKPYLGGVERHVSAVQQELKSNGVAVDIACASVGTNPNSAIILGESWYDPRALLSLIKLLKTREYDVVHANDAPAMIITGIAAAVTAYPFNRLFLTTHGFEGPEKWKRYVWAHRLAHKLAHKAFSVSALVDRLYKTESNAVLIGGVGAVQPLKASGRKRVIFLGRIDSDTDALPVARAFVMASESNEQVDFLIYGFGALEDEIKKVTRGTKVEFRGKTATPESVLAEATLVVANSYLSALEAMSLGKPVLSLSTHWTKISTMKDLQAASNDALTECESEATFAQFVKYLVTNEDAYSEMSKRAIVFSSRHLWRNVAADYVNLWSVE